MVNEEYVIKGKMTIKDISNDEEITFKFDKGVFLGKCVVYSNDYKIKTQKNRDDSKILIKISVPIL